MHSCTMLVQESEECSAASPIPVNLRVARARKGWSKVGLANRAGVSRNTIDRIEAGHSPSTRILHRLSAALGVPTHELLRD